jgi:hypothetical protein
LHRANLINSIAPDIRVRLVIDLGEQ